MTDIAHAWSEITLESAKFVLEQAEKNVQATIDTAESLTNRAVNVMQFSIPLSLALVGLIAADPKKELLWLYLIVLILSMLISYKALQLYDMFTIRSLGYPPTTLLSDENLKIGGEHQHLGFVFSVIQDMDAIIVLNENSNHQRQQIMYVILLLVKACIGFTCLYLAILFGSGVVPI